MLELYHNNVSVCAQKPLRDVPRKTYPTQSTNVKSMESAGTLWYGGVGTSRMRSTSRTIAQH